MKGTQDEPAESIEDAIASAIDERESEDDEETEVEEEQSEDAEEEPEADSEYESAEVDADDDSEGDTEESADEDGEPDEPDDDPDPGEDGSEDKLTAPQHWREDHRELFEKQPREVQDFLMERHKDMEAHFTRRNQELAETYGSADVRRQYDAMKDALAPFEQEFSAKGLDHAGAVRQIASFHNLLKSGGKDAVLQIANMYGIDMAEPDDEDIEPAIREIRNQQKEVQRILTQQQQEAQQREQSHINQMIQDFKSETDDSGALKHPHFDALEREMTGLVQAGMAQGLEDAYSKALALRPDLGAAKPTPKVEDKKTSQAEKVRKAKRAATGVKSSGAARKPSKQMTLEEEIASMIPQ